MPDSKSNSEVATAAAPGHPHPRGLSWAVILLTLGVLAAGLTVTHWRLRATLREQIARRDAEVFSTFAQLEELATAPDPHLDPLGLDSSTGDAEVDALLQSERLNETIGRIKGIAGARLFDREGHLIISSPPSLLEATPTPRDWEEIRAFRPVTRFRSHVRPSTLFAGLPTDPGETPPLPLLEVLLPLRNPQQQLIGAAQLLLPGGGIAAEYANLDRHLLQQGLLIFFLGGGGLALALRWAFRQLEQANRLLAARTTDLLQANSQLALAARTSAVGAVTAHLIHGLKNPLSGLHQFVTHQGVQPTGNGDPAWNEAVNSTRRMQTIIQEVVRVLHDEQELTPYELSYRELFDLLGSRATLAARQADVGLRFTGEVAGGLDNRTANLVLLILENLITNALQATPPHQEVEVQLTQALQGITFRVRDTGPGLPESLRKTLFAPVRSTKPGGTGIGLAISRQLAHHLGATLELESTSPQGTVFALTLPHRNQSLRLP